MRLLSSAYKQNLANELSLPLRDFRIVDPSLPKYIIGGCIANAGSCKIGFRPIPSSKLIEFIK